MSSEHLDLTRGRESDAKLRLVHVHHFNTAQILGASATLIGLFQFRLTDLGSIVMRGVRTSTERSPSISLTSFLSTISISTHLSISTA